METEEQSPSIILRLPDLARETVLQFVQAAEQMRHARVVVLDLAAPEPPDSTTLGVIVGVLARLRDRGSDMCVVIGSAELRRTWGATGLARVWRIYETFETALQRSIPATSPGRSGPTL